MGCVLDPASGAVTAAAQTLQYWIPWTLPNDYLYLNPQSSCAHLSTPDLLRNLVSRCGDWAQFFADTLAVQGITDVTPAGVTDTGPGNPVPGTFPTFPAPAPGVVGIMAEFMLISAWAFPGPATGTDPSFPYLTTDTVNVKAGKVVAGSGALGAGPEFNDAPGVPGQGPDANPPGWFLYGDHAIDVYNNMVYDPSYGVGPFATIGAWATASLSGFAYMTSSTGPPDAMGVRVRTYVLAAHMGLP